MLRSGSVCHGFMLGILLTFLNSVAFAGDCNISAMLKRYERVGNQRPVGTFDVENRQSVNGGRLRFWKLGQATLVERLDYGESGERARKVFVQGTFLLLEDSTTIYFSVGETPDARLTQSRVVNRVVICDSGLVSSPPLPGGEDKVKIALEVLSGIAVEQRSKRYIDAQRLESLEATLVNRR